MKGGRVTTSQGAYLYKKRTDTEKAKFLMPDVGYTTREVSRSLTEEQGWTYKGDPFPIEFVVEIDTLQGSESNLRELERKNTIYFAEMGVKLAWLIDPKNKIMRVYTKDADPAGYSCSEDLSWRDLDGGSILPGFKVSTFSLDAVMNAVLTYLYSYFLHRNLVLLMKMNLFSKTAARNIRLWVH
jgi:hypothetical protein